jgi:hypothetical protein
MLMNYSKSEIILNNPSDQWMDFYCLTFFCAFFSFLIFAHFSNQLDQTGSFLPKKPKILICGFLIGAVFGAWYAFYETIDNVYAISCKKNEGRAIFFSPLNQKNIPTDSILMRPALVAYRGGRPWRLRFFSSAGYFDTEQISVSEMEKIREALRDCGIRDK